MDGGERRVGLNSKIKIYSPEALGEPLGLYEHISRVQASSELLYLAGQLAVDREGNVVGENDFESQMRQVFSNIREALRSADADFGDVFKFTTYLTDSENIEHFMRVRSDLFPELFSSQKFPPNTLLIVDRLVHSEFLIEVEAIAAL